MSDTVYKKMPFRCTPSHFQQHLPRHSKHCQTYPFAEDEKLVHDRTILLVQVKGEFSALQLKSAVKVVVVVRLYRFFFGKDLVHSFSRAPDSPAAMRVRVSAEMCHNMLAMHAGPAAA